MISEKTRTVILFILLLIGIAALWYISHQADVNLVQ